MTNQQELGQFVADTATMHGVPGAAVGVWSQGQELIVCSGVTSVENPLAVDQDTMFVIGSVSKTFAATALMRLVAQGRVELEAPVRRYVPELILADEAAAASITVLQLLNHTAGFDWRTSAETGDGDDALAAYVTALAHTPLIAGPGTRTSYSQIGYNLAGRVIERVTGLTYERAVRTQLLDPLQMTHSTYTLSEAITRRFSVGHNLRPGGSLEVARQWKDTRANNPGGGLASSVADLLVWARFHLDDGRTATGTRLLPADALQRMQQPTATLEASTLGDAIGIGWFLRDVDGAQIVSHAGSGNGQFAELHLVPDRGLAITVLSNAGPDAGLAFNHDTVTWALDQFGGINERAPQTLPFDLARANEVVGRYANELMDLILTTGADGLTIECRIKPDIRAATDTELPPDMPPARVELLPGEGDEYLIVSGGLNGQRGHFTRDSTNTVTSADLAGRVFRRAPHP